MSLAKSFFVSSTQVVIASLRFVCSSCCRIDSLTLLSAVVSAGLMSPIGSMMWKPYCVFTGRETWPSLRRNAVWSNGATVWPRAMVSLPPCDADAGSLENFFASAAKSPPSWSCS